MKETIPNKKSTLRKWLDSICMNYELLEIKKFTDPHAKEIYKQAKKRVNDATIDIDSEQSREDIEKSLLSIKKIADKERLKALAPKEGFLIAACYYLALAQKDITISGCTPDRFYHYAANTFRDYGLLQNAAKGYYNAAWKCYDKHKTTNNNQDPESKKKAIIFGKRSAGRAKMLFKQLGCDKDSDQAHVIQQRLRILELKKEKTILLLIIYWLWGLISGYGTNAYRWLISTLFVIITFAITYPILINDKHIIVSSVKCIEIHRSGLSLITSSLLFSFGNLFQFGMLAILTPITWFGQSVITLHGIIAFVLLGTGATFFTRR